MTRCHAKPATLFACRNGTSQNLLGEDMKTLTEKLVGIGLTTLFILAGSSVMAQQRAQVCMDEDGNRVACEVDGDGLESADGTGRPESADGTGVESEEEPAEDDG